MMTLSPLTSISFKYGSVGSIGVANGTHFAMGLSASENAFIAASSNRTGYAIGGGLEYAFSGAWSVRAEYLYVDLGSFNAGPAPFTNNVSFNANLVRAGINYRF